MKILKYLGFILATLLCVAAACIALTLYASPLLAS